MKRLRELVGRELDWSQPQALKRHFELKSGEGVVATLSFRSLFGSFATATTAEGKWTFKRVALGWYLAVVMHEESGATAAAAG